MIKHDSGACLSYCLSCVMTNITSSQRSMKYDRLGYLNHCISKWPCLLPPHKMFSLNSPYWGILHEVSPHRRALCWSARQLTCIILMCALTSKMSSVFFNCHLSVLSFCCVCCNSFFNLPWNNCEYDLISFYIEKKDKWKKTVKESDTK